MLDGSGRGSGRYARDEVSPKAWRTSPCRPLVVRRVDSSSATVAATVVDVGIVVTVGVGAFHGARSPSEFGESAPTSDVS